MEENKKEVLISVKVDNQSAISSTENLKKQFNQLTKQALDFDKIDYDNATIGQLRDNLSQANNVLKDLKSSGLATEQQLSDMGKTVGKLKDNISGIKIGNVFKGVESSIMGIVGTSQLLTGAMGALGIESEGVEKSIQKMMALMSLKDGIEGLSKYTDGMKSLMGATTGASSATNILRIGFASLGIGLIISAVVYLTNNWDKLSTTIKEFLPEMDSVSKQFQNIVPIAEGVGKAVIGFIVRPIQKAIEAFNLLKNGDWKGAGKSIIEALNPLAMFNNIVKDFKSGYATGIINANKKKNEEVKKDNKKANNESLAEAKRLADEQKKLIDEVYNYIVNANKLIEDSNKTTRQIELDDLEEFYNLQIDKAKQLGVDTSQLLEARRLKQLSINKKYNDEELKLAKENKEKALQAGVTTANMVGQTDVLNASTNSDVSKSDGLEKLNEVKLNALKLNYEAEQLLYADNQEKLLLLEAQYANNVYNLHKELSDKKKEEKDKDLELEKKNNDLKLESNIFLADAITAIAGENTAIGKASAIASATMNTYQSATKALAEVPHPYSYVVAASNIAMGLANVKKILTTKTPGSSTTSSGSITAPTINTTQLQPRATQDVRIIDNTATQNQNTVKAYIVNKDLNQQKESDKFYNSASTF